MAEFLIMARTVTHSNPKVNEEGCWKENDIVDVRDDDADWRPEERNPHKFKIKKVKNLSLEDAKEYCQPALDPLNLRRSLYSYLEGSDEMLHKINGTKTKATKEDLEAESKRKKGK